MADDRPHSPRIDPSITVLVALAADADDQRQDLGRALDDSTDLVQAGPPATRADQVVDEVTRVLPDVVVLHQRLAGLGTLGLVGRLGVVAPSTRVVLVADDGADDDAYEALLGGASGVLGQSASSSSIAGAVRIVARNGGVLTAGCARRLLEDAPRAVSSPDDPFRRGLALTAVEEMVLGRLASGAALADIAVERQVTERLVALHVGYAVRKLHDFVQRTLTRRRLGRSSGDHPPHPSES